MRYKTHLVTTLAIALPIMVATDTLSIGSATVLSLGALLPDIDEPHSYIGARTRGLSDILCKIFGHRGFTHSLLGLILVFLTVVMMVSLTDFQVHTALYLSLGYALHLVEDSFSKSGVKWLLPLSETQFKSGLGIVYYTTGGMVENFILLGAMLILFFEVKTLDFSTIQMPDFHISSILNFIIAKVNMIMGS